MGFRVGHGDASLTAILSRQSSNLRTEIARRSSEMSSGVQQDLGAAVRGDFAALAGVEQSLARLRGYSANSTEAAMTADAMQTALSVIFDGSAELGANIMRIIGPGSANSMQSLVIESGRAFETAVATLNTRFAERGLFSGVDSAAVALPPAAEILTALEGAVAGAVTIEDIRNAVAQWFEDPGGYAAIYNGGVPRADLPIAEGEMASLKVTAMEPALKSTLQALATAALLDRGLLANQLEARAQLMQSVGADLLSGGDAQSQLIARVGTVQAQITAAQSRNSAEKSALEVARSDLISADPFDTATRLEDLQTRLQQLYLVTSRVSKLSLADYL